MPPGPVDHQLYGPPGTEWLFPVRDYLDRLSVPGVASALGQAAKALGDEARAAGVGLGTTWGWRTPENAHESPATERGTPMTIKVLRATIHAKLGNLEEVAHVLHFRTQPAPDADLDAAAVKRLGGVIASQWKDFLNQPVTPFGQGAPVRDYLPRPLVYDEVRVAYLAVSPQAPGAPRPPKPDYLIPTQYVATLPQTSGNADQASLPYEVAMALSFNTDLRGARHRGRVFLGPWATSVMRGVVATSGNNQVDTAGFDGLFNGIERQVAKAFGASFIQPIRDQHEIDLHVLSAKFAESWAVTGVRAGAVPDSQRRRRRNQIEAYDQSWGHAPGQLPG